MNNSSRETFHKLTLVIKAIGGGLWEYDIDADEIHCNRRWYEMLGLEERATPIKSIQDFRPHIHSDDVQRATEVDLEKVEHWLASDETYHVDFRIIRPTGEIRWMRSVACLIRDSKSHHRAAIGCLTDISDLRQSEATPILSLEWQQPSTGHSGLHRPLDVTEGPPPLTQRERACLMWVSLGKTATETAIIENKSRRTVEFHLNNAVRKLGAANKIHATAIAIRLGLI